MFHDFKPIVHDSPDDFRQDEWKRIVRPIYSRFWRGVHNIIAHPLMGIYRPLGKQLHDYTAKQMYQPRIGVKPINTDSD